jgi:glucan phosphoethanolaminetransferase (alkaline phosphatase superfamily)
MYNTLLFLHSLLRWVILLLAIIAIWRSYTGMNAGKPFTSADRKTGLFLLIAAHITLLIGIYQWFMSPLGFKGIQDLGFGAVMKDPVYRFYGVEHLTGMIIAIVLITIGRGVSKKNIPDRAKHKKTFWFFLIALIIILISIPWPFRVGIGRPLLPGG